MLQVATYIDFIESFNRLEKYLKKYTKSDDTESFNDILFKSSNHPMVKLYFDDLHLFRKLRNIIIHHTQDFDQLIATPSDEIIERILFVEKEITDPTDVAVFTKDVTIFDASDSLEVVLKISGEKGITKFPIYENQKFLGLITSRGVVNWLQQHVNSGSIELTAQLKDILPLEQTYRYKLVKSTLSIYDAWHLFRENKERIDALIVTKSGEETDKIDAVITYTDLLKFMYNHKQYVFIV